VFGFKIAFCLLRFFVCEIQFCNIFEVGIVLFECFRRVGLNG
jgi:hypothetical protein